MIPISNDSIPWVEKYRPKKLDEVIAHQEIVKTIKKLLKQNGLPHLLFHGPPGTGKTSMILAVANQLYEQKVYHMVLDLNASDDRGIHVVRQEIQDFASTKRFSSSGFKLIILDECDSMTKDAQFALRRVIEKYTKNTRFCLICNYINKIIPALQSRCTRFRFAPLDELHVRNRLMDVIDQENVSITPNAIKTIIRLGRGDMRSVLNIIQSTNMACTTITEDMAYECTGNPRPEDIETIVNLLFNATFIKCFKHISEIQSTKNIALLDIVGEMQPYVTQRQLSKMVLIELLEALAEVSYMLSIGSTEKLQLAFLIGSFILTRN
jgi:replication factor C subunit 3/5